MSSEVRTVTRGSPIYLRSGGQVVSLVPEVVERAGRLPRALRAVSASAVYVIDDAGIAKLRLNVGKFRRATLFAPALLLAPIQYLLYLLLKRKG